jgi:hypothetical protein
MIDREIRDEKTERDEDDAGRGSESHARRKSSGIHSSRVSDARKRQSCDRPA